MGTAIHVEAWGDDRVVATAAIDAVMHEMHRIDALMSPYKESSELSRINRDAARAPVESQCRIVRPAGAIDRVFRAVRRRFRHHVRKCGPLCTTIAGASGRRRSSCRSRANRSAIGICNSTVRRVPCALRVQACASTSAVLRRVTRSTTVRRFSPDMACAMRWWRPAATAGCWVIAAAGRGRSAYAIRAARVRWWRCFRSRMSPYPPRATTSATSMTATSAAIT